MLAFRFLRATCKQALVRYSHRSTPLLPRKGGRAVCCCSDVYFTLSPRFALSAEPSERGGPRWPQDVHWLLNRFAAGERKQV
jgi:hypothetical protein